jgi:hypothetical protein
MSYCTNSGSAHAAAAAGSIRVTRGGAPAVPTRVNLGRGYLLKVISLSDFDMACSMNNTRLPS